MLHNDEYVGSQLHQLEIDYVQFTYLKTGADVLSAIAQLSEDHHALGGHGDGRGWMTPKTLLDQVIAADSAAALLLHGWMTTIMTIDTTDVAYQTLEQGWDSSDLGDLAFDSTKTEMAKSSWNAVFAIAQGIHSLFN